LFHGPYIFVSCLDLICSFALALFLFLFHDPGIFCSAFIDSICSFALALFPFLFHDPYIFVPHLDSICSFVVVLFLFVPWSLYFCSVFRFDLFLFASLVPLL
jgi:hypothetical protein